MVFEWLRWSGSSEQSGGTSSDTSVSCSSTPKSCRVDVHEPDMKRVHYGYFTTKVGFSRTRMRVYEKYWHECRVCGSTCDHHEETVGVIAVTDDGLRIVSGGESNE